MSENELSYIEESLKIELPSFYKEFMINYPIDLMKTDAADFALIIDSERLIEENINAKNDFWGLPLNSDSFIIGENGCGDYYLIQLKEDESIFTFFHDDNSFYKVSNTIKEYYNKIISQTIEDVWGNPEFLAKDMRENIKTNNKVLKSPSKQSDHNESQENKWWQFWKKVANKS